MAVKVLDVTCQRVWCDDCDRFVSIIFNPGEIALGHPEQAASLHRHIHEEQRSALGS